MIHAFMQEITQRNTLITFRSHLLRSPPRESGPLYLSITFSCNSNSQAARTQKTRRERESHSFKRILFSEARIRPIFSGFSSVEHKQNEKQNEIPACSRNASRVRTGNHHTSTKFIFNVGLSPTIAVRKTDKLVDAFYPLSECQYVAS